MMSGLCKTMAATVGCEDSNLGLMSQRGDEGYYYDYYRYDDMTI